MDQGTIQQRNEQQVAGEKQSQCQSQWEVAKVSQVWRVLSKCAFPIVFLRRETHKHTHTEWEHTMHKATSRRLPCLAGKIHTHTLTQANMHFDSWHIRYESVYRRLGCRAFPLTLWTQRSA